MRKPVLAGALAFAVVAAAACTDPESSSNRGYTKAPLEDPGYTIEAEKASEMTELGDAPKRPRPRELEVNTDSGATTSGP